jgi:hypothetical protein
MALIYTGGYAEYRLPPAIIFESFRLGMLLIWFALHGQPNA